MSRRNEASWAPCIAADGEALGGGTLSGGTGAPYFPDLRWESRKQLYVQFLNRIPTWRLTPNPPGNFLATSDILKWANVWSSKKLGLEGVPKFTEWREGDEGESDIRVKFETKSGSESLIGIDAQSHRGEKTMILNLAKDDDGYRKYTVIHEFGHALGLVHEHQMPRLAEAIDESAMIQYLMGWGMTEDKAKEKFKRDFASYSEAPENTVPEKAEFDPQSIMSYPIPEECIKTSCRDHFTREQLEMITSQRTTLSEIDIKTVKKLYPSGKKQHPRPSITRHRASKPQSSTPIRRRSRKQPYQRTTPPPRILRQQHSTLPPIDLTVAQQAIARDPSQLSNLTVDRTSFPHLQQQCFERGYLYVMADGLSIGHVKPKHYRYTGVNW